MARELGPVESWLRTRLQGRPSLARDVTDDALLQGYPLPEVLKAKKAMAIESVPTPSGIHWALPNSAPAPPAVPALPEPTPEPRAELVVTRADAIPRPRPKPDEAVRKASNLIKRAAPSAARFVRDLAEKATTDGPPCPACGRAQLRNEELRLKAANSVMDRAGLGAGRGNVVPEDHGPLIVFPPGTQIAILANVPNYSEESGVGRAPAEQELRAVRADHYQTGAAD